MDRHGIDGQRPAAIVQYPLCHVDTCELHDPSHVDRHHGSAADESGTPEQTIHALLGRVSDFAANISVASMPDGNRRERVAIAIAGMNDILDMLDELGLDVAAAHVSMAVDVLLSESSHRAR